jgi:hypothetical protein
MRVQVEKIDSLHILVFAYAERDLIEAGAMKTDEGI